MNPQSYRLKGITYPLVPPTSQEEIKRLKWVAANYPRPDVRRVAEALLTDAPTQSQPSFPVERGETGISASTRAPGPYASRWYSQDEVEAMAEADRIAALEDEQAMEKAEQERREWLAHPDLQWTTSTGQNIKVYVDEPDSCLLVINDREQGRYELEPLTPDQRVQDFVAKLWRVGIREAHCQRILFLQQRLLQEGLDAYHALPRDKQLSALCERATDEAVIQGDPQAKQELRTLMEQYGIHESPRDWGHHFYCIFELEGIRYRLQHYPRRQGEIWTFGRDPQQGPIPPSTAGEQANYQQTCLEMEQGQRKTHYSWKGRRYAFEPPTTLAEVERMAFFILRSTSYADEARRTMLAARDEQHLLRVLRFDQQDEGDSFAWNNWYDHPVREASAYITLVVHDSGLTDPWISLEEVRELEAASARSGARLIAEEQARAEREAPTLALIETACQLWHQYGGYAVIQQANDLGFTQAQTVVESDTRAWDLLLLIATAMNYHSWSGKSRYEQAIEQAMGERGYRFDERPMTLSSAAFRLDERLQAQKGRTQRQW